MDERNVSSAGYSAVDVIEMAMRIEEKGSSFYRTAAEKSGMNVVKDLFVRLADKEDEHKKVFAGILSKLPGNRSEKNLTLPSDVETYLRSVADKAVFFDPESTNEQFFENAALSDVFSAAMEMEKDSILFYSGLLNLLESEKDKEPVFRIIREEKGHLEELSRYSKGV